VGKQAPPARAAPSLVRALRDARGALLFAAGTSLTQYRKRCPFLQVDGQAGTTKRPSAEQRNSISPMASHQRAGTILYSLQAGVDNLVDTGGAIKERKTAFPAPNKKL
jgi:hypothetical protein